jgi:hypothetical protein
MIRLLSKNNNSKLLQLVRTMYAIIVTGTLNSIGGLLRLYLKKYFFNNFLKKDTAKSMRMEYMLTLIV